MNDRSILLPVIIISISTKLFFKRKIILLFVFIDIPLSFFLIMILNEIFTIIIYENKYLFKYPIFMTSAICVYILLASIYIIVYHILNKRKSTIKNKS